MVKQRATSIQAKRHKGLSLFCCKKPPKTEHKETELTHHQRANVKNMVFDFCCKEQDRKYSFLKSIDDKAYMRTGMSVGFRDVKKMAFISQQITMLCTNSPNMTGLMNKGMSLHLLTAFLLKNLK